jgi:hypothetical protein
VIHGRLSTRQACFVSSKAKAHSHAVTELILGCLKWTREYGTVKEYLLAIHSYVSRQSEAKNVARIRKYDTMTARQTISNARDYFFHYPKRRAAEDTNVL